MEKVVQRVHEAYYSNPIVLKKGEAFTLTGRQDAWEDNPEHIWLWAVARDGREGWVPDGFAIMVDGEAAAPYDYFARELNVVCGELLHILKESNGWAWCKNSAGETGWVPQKVFMQEDQ